VRLTKLFELFAKRSGRYVLETADIESGRFTDKHDAHGDENDF